jgi:hypothetical protein
MTIPPSIIYTDPLYEILLHDFFKFIADNSDLPINKYMFCRRVKIKFGNKFAKKVKDSFISLGNGPYLQTSRIDELLDMVPTKAIAQNEFYPLFHSLLYINYEVSPAVKLVTTQAETMLFNLTNEPIIDYIYPSSDGLYPLTIFWLGNDKLQFMKDKQKLEPVVIRTYDIANNCIIKLLITDIWYCIDYICIKFEIMSMVYYSRIPLSHLLILLNGVA